MLQNAIGALKADFTRTGVRTMKGRLQDAYNSISRYVRNHFFDDSRQASIDLFHGKFIVDYRGSLSMNADVPSLGKTIDDDDGPFQSGAGSGSEYLHRSSDHSSKSSAASTEAVSGSTDVVNADVLTVVDRFEVLLVRRDRYAPQHVQITVCFPEHHVLESVIESDGKGKVESHVGCRTDARKWGVIEEGSQRKMRLGIPIQVWKDQVDPAIANVLFPGNKDERRYLFGSRALRDQACACFHSLILCRLGPHQQHIHVRQCFAHVSWPEFNAAVEQQDTQKLSDMIPSPTWQAAAEALCG